MQNRLKKLKTQYNNKNECSDEKKLINCGCGMKFSTKWINIDFNSPFQCVKNCNLLKGLPFEDKYADFIYNSNFLEHLTEDQAVFFIKECYRVLKLEGILRIVVPDLEDIAKEYLKKLEDIKKQPYNKKVEKEYDYIKIELLDQMVRRIPGGKMAEYWQKNGITKYVRYRSGNIKDTAQYNKHLKQRKSFQLTAPRFIHRFLSYNKKYKIYEIGKFEVSGEKHLWMYDEYSLCRILRRCGFNKVTVMGWNESQLSDFKEYELEVDSKGNEYKPHCLYVEAIK